MKKILIIEDDQFMASIYRDKFQSEGFEADIAENGKTGIDKLNHSPPDAVLLDLMMPEVNGVEVLKFIRSQPALRALPVIVLSNAYVGSMVQAAWKEGANKCLTKASCTPNHLVEEVRRVLAANGTISKARAPLAAGPDAGARLDPSDDTAGPSPASARQDLQLRMTSLLHDLRHLLQNLIKSDEDNRLARLVELYRGVRALAASAGFAELLPIARLGSALEALVNELHVKPARMNSSSMHTVAQAVDLLAVLVEQAGSSHFEMLVSPLILVLDDEPISRETVCTALEKVHLRAISLGDPAIALKLMEENRFDLVFLDIDIPGASGFEICKKLHASPANERTPVVFVTALTDFENRTHSALSGGTDFIAKPIVLIELAVKALIHLLHGQIPPARPRT